ncbi:MAG: repressor LexA, partial [Pseudomonadales bacterium]|nr:repressor LexA [Pseudomonadales bacterium]
TEVRDGQIVVARVADEVTVKRFEKLTSPRYCRLMPENPNHEPILVDMEQGDFAIEGVSVGILRLSS